MYESSPRMALGVRGTPWDNHCVRAVAAEILQNFFDNLGNLLGYQAKIFKKLACWSRFTEAIDADYATIATHILVPPGRNAGLDRHAPATSRQHRITVSDALCIDDIGGRQRDDAHLTALGSQKLPRVPAQPPL
mgnify:CR=1 FL=1